MLRTHFAGYPRPSTRGETVASSGGDIQHFVSDRPITQPPRARAIAELPCDALFARADELARRWAIALILARPLDGMSEIPLAELACDAPALCAQALRAVQSDVELERLTGRGAPSGREDSAAARRLAAICGAHEAAALADAVEALRGVLWEALLEELREPSARLVGDIGDRLAHVCAAALAAAIETASFAEHERADAPQGVVEAQASVARAAAREPSSASVAAGPAVIVDERARAGAASQERERPLSWDESPPVPPRASRARIGTPAWGEPSALPDALEPEIEIRDERGEEGPAAWIGSIGAQLERFERDALPFAVLLVELVEIERLRRRESPEELSRLAGQMERALAAEVGAAPSGSMTRERPGRCWMLAPGTDRAGAERLAERLRRAVALGVSGRGAPLAVAIGTAVCPEDGREAAALAAHADVGLYAARSAARSTTGRPRASADEPA